MTSRRTPIDVAVGIYLAVMCVLGVLSLARVPGDTLRVLPLSSLMWTVTMGCCGVTAEALANARPWRMRAAAALAVAFALTGVAHAVDWALTGTYEWLPVSGRLAKTLFMSFVLLYMILTDRPDATRHRTRTRVPPA